MNAFEKLEVCKQSVLLSAELYKNKITRAVFSIHSNITQARECDSIINFTIWPITKHRVANFKRS